MKTIKIILIIISVFALLFLATGLVVKETNYTASVIVDKPAEVVFNAFADVESSKNWIPEIKTIETVNKNAGVTGSVYNITIQNNDQEINMSEKILAYVPHKKITFFFDAENMLKKDDYNFTEENGKTKITLNAKCQSDSYIVSCIFPYFKGTFQEQSQMYLNNFKDFVEETK
ncbi:SRPBCC family protein [uncultured Polaribacter sp.]|uniref:SRPBCC family protein n=1 Tax=uncultured Polaribacter sp. TaxID=174711 RepID=UPI002605F944|nr:SRPBCC family protein [uncultured Polaribacter sp.]